MRLPLLLLSAALITDADQSWPQWGGPNRNFHVTGEQVGWTGSAPRRAWTRHLGDGYSAVIGDATTLYTAFRRDETMIVSAIDAATGRERWEQ